MEAVALSWKHDAVTVIEDSGEVGDALKLYDGIVKVGYAEFVIEFAYCVSASVVGVASDYGAAKPGAKQGGGAGVGSTKDANVDGFAEVAEVRFRLS